MSVETDLEEFHVPTDRPPVSNGHDPEAEEGGSGRVDILDDGEDVSEVSDRDLILRAVNASLVAKQIGDKVDALSAQLDVLATKLDVLADLVLRAVASKG